MMQNHTQILGCNFEGEEIMKYVFWGGLALVSAVLLPQLATAEPDIDRMSVKDLLPLAQNEGRVTVYSFTSRIARVV